jgi:hypothetical protein
MYDSDVLSILANWKTPIGIGIGYEISKNLTDASIDASVNHEFNLSYWLK